MISIIIPIYNAESYLTNCLDSIIKQNYQDIEIICVDDGSEDASSSILEQYQKKDKRIIVYRQVNQGLSGARNAGIELANGEWCMFVDSDDWLVTDCCQQAINVSHNVDLVIFSYIRDFTNKSLPKFVFDDQEIAFKEKDVPNLYRRLISPTGEELKNPEKMDSLSTAWGKLYKTDIIKHHHIQFIDTKQIGTEDLLFNVYYFSYINSAHYIPLCLYHYRKAENCSLSSANKPNLIEQWENLFAKIEEWISPLNKKELIAALNTRRALCITGIGLNILFAHENHFAQYKKIKDFMQKKWYRKAVSQLPLDFFPIHWKLFFGCAKYNFPFCIYLFLISIYKIIYK